VEYVGLEIADIFELAHPEAIDTNPRKYQVLRDNIDFDADVVQVEAVDVSLMSGTLFVLGDRNQLPSKWTEANTEEQQYGYLADRVTGNFSEGMPGKVLY
jgi:hypothetical protein